jgi:uncharacterized protein (DUF342 family)
MATVEPAVRIEIAPDRMSAYVLVPAEFPRELLTPELCMLALREQQVAVGPSVEQAVAEAVQQFTAAPADLRRLVARGTPAADGQDGHVEWFVREPEPEIPADAQAVSHYDRTTFIFIDAWQEIGRVVPPTQGADGYDVTGMVIAARSASPAVLRLDETIAQRPDGVLVAQIGGVLIREGLAARISSRLEIAGNVDFSTGNIRFKGDVVVAGGIGDKFEVSSDGSVQVAGLVEGALITCRRDLTADGGIAAKQQGRLTVGGNLIARYLDNVDATIAGIVSVEKEIINCRLEIGDQVQCPHAAVMGGQLHVAGCMQIGILGSPAGVPTQLHLASLPKLEASLLRIQAMADKLAGARKRVAGEYDVLRTLGGTLSNMDKERVTQFVFDLHNIDATCQRLAEAQQKIRDQIAARTCISLSVMRRVQRGVRLIIAGEHYEFHETLNGQLMIQAGANGRPMCSYRGTTMPLHDLARPARLAA